MKTTKWRIINSGRGILLIQVFDFGNWGDRNRSRFFRQRRCETLKKGQFVVDFLGNNTILDADLAVGLVNFEVVQLEGMVIHRWHKWKGCSYV